MAKKTNVDVKKTSTNKGGYGLLSLMAMIIGIVIGSGIFVKNAGLISSAGSSSIVALTWIVGALVVIAIVIAFIEIISITEISGEQSTTANWGRKLLGIRFGKMIGFYITLIYFPIIIAALFQFASQSFLETISYATTNNTWYTDLVAKGNEFNYMLATIGVAFLFLVVVMIINAFTVKPGKYLQNIGTMVKTIPLFFVIIVFIYMIGANADQIQFATADDLANLDANSGTQSTFTLVMATIPAVLFAFDGFLLAGALSKEAKKPSTFRWAFILSMVFIIVIYLTFSVATLGLGQFGEVVNADGDFLYYGNEFGAYGTITNTIYSVFDESKADIISPVINGIITLSILTGVSGCGIAASRSLSDLSAHNTIKDPELKYVHKNRFGVSEGAGLAMMLSTLFWFVLVTGMDAYISHETGIMLSVAGFSSDLVVIGAFFLYSLIILGALFNRMKKKDNRVPVKKNLLFIPAALVGSLLTLLITFYYAYMVFEPVFADPSDTIAMFKLIYFVIFMAAIVFLYVYNSMRTWKLKEDFIIKKKAAVAVYYGEEGADNLIPEALVRERLNTIETKLEEYVSKSEEKHAKEIAELKAKLDKKSKK